MCSQLVWHHVWLDTLLHMYSAFIFVCIYNYEHWTYIIVITNVDGQYFSSAFNLWVYCEYLWHIKTLSYLSCYYSWNISIVYLKIFLDHITRKSLCHLFSILLLLLTFAIRRNDRFKLPKWCKYCLDGP